MKKLLKYIDITSVDIIINGIPKVVNNDFIKSIQKEDLIIPSKKMIIHEINLNSSINFGNTIKIRGVMNKVESEDK